MKFGFALILGTFALIGAGCNKSADGNTGAAPAAPVASTPNQKGPKVAAAPAMGAFPGAGPGLAPGTKLNGK